MAGDAALRQRKPDAATNGQASSSSAPPDVGATRVTNTRADAAAERMTPRKRREVLSGMGTIAFFFALVVRC